MKESAIDYKDELGNDNSRIIAGYKNAVDFIAILYNNQCYVTDFTILK